MNIAYYSRKPKPVYLLLLALISISKRCDGKIEGRIINGYTVDIQYFPYMASLQVDGRHICGGAIVSSNVVVTAAHCTIYPAEFYKLRIGSTHYDRNGTMVTVKQQIRHENYNQQTADYDVAVLILNDTIDFAGSSGTIAPLKLPSIDYVTPTGLGVVVLGWGTTNAQDNTQTSTTLRSASLRTINTTDCIPMFPPDSITDRMICAQNFNAKQDACTGDSGGPMVGRGQLLGIISWGINCADKKYPGVYTNVPKIVDFIQMHL